MTLDNQTIHIIGRKKFVFRKFACHTRRRKKEKPPEKNTQNIVEKKKELKSFTLKRVFYIRNTTDNKLIKNACDYVCMQWYSYYDSESIITDILKCGCKSGIVCDLVEETSIVDFYEKFKNEIDEILHKKLTELNLNSPEELFGDEWDKNDSLVNENNNKKLLAWFGFDESIKILGLNFNFVRDYLEGKKSIKKRK